MNTFNALSSLFSPRSTTPPPLPINPSTSSNEITSTTSQDSPPINSISNQPIASTSTTSNDTVYITARRSSRPGERPKISVSLTSPAHLLGMDVLGSDLVPPGYTRTEGIMGDDGITLRRGAQDVPLPESPVGDIDLEWDSDQGEGEEQEKERDDVASSSSTSRRKDSISRRNKTVEEDEEDREGERRLKLREKERIVNASKMWPLRLGVSIYVFLRHFLSLVGFTYTSNKTNTKLKILEPPLAPTISFPSPTTDSDEIDEKTPLLPTPPTPPPLTRSSTPTLSFFLRRSPTPPSISPLASPSLTSSATLSNPPRAPKLTPKTLVLDLDETLIHSTSRPYSSASRSGLKVRVVEVVLEGRSTVYTVYKRPWVDFFLRKVSTWYTVIIFTASLPEYADPVIDWLDGGDGGGGMVAGRLFRSVSKLFSRIL